MEWTREQKTIIDYRGGNLLVSAAAGSGKTAVLVQRILEWVVQDEKNIDEFLVVTFTRAAASQMKNKIRYALEAVQAEQPDNQHVIKQLSLIHRANITTIDSFCKQIVDENFQVLGLDPAMRIMDETEGKLMQEDVLERVLEQAYEQQADAMMELHQYMNDMRSDDNIRNLLRKIARQADSFPYPEEWLSEAEKDAAIVDADELEQQPWMQILVSEVRSLMGEVKEIPEQISLEYQYLEPEYQPKTYEKYCTYFQEECQLVRKVLQAKTYSALAEAFDTSKRVLKRFVWKNTGVPEVHYMTELWERYSTVKKQAAEYVKKDMEEICEQQKRTASVLHTILELTGRFRMEYQKEKQKKNCMDFSDVEHYALQALVEKSSDGAITFTEIAKQLQDTYVEILIDEYQDSNDLQEAILTGVAKQNPDGYCNLFMVGDIKQSIYKFRMARPKLFQEKYESFSEDLEHAGNSKLVELKRNFRSRETVLESVNLCFYQLMSQSLGGINYTEQVALVPGREFKSGEGSADYRSEVLFLDMFSGEEEETDIQEELASVTREALPSDETEALDKVEAEARLAAARIQELCNFHNPLPVWDEGLQDYRPCMYKDIVILLRTVKGWAETFQRVLMDNGIPVYAESGKGYFDSVEVKNLLCMLAVIDNARDDIALAGVLRSPLVSVTNDDLAHMRSACKQGDLWTVIQNYLTWQEARPELVRKLTVFLERLQIWKEQKTYSTIRELIWNILNTTGYFEYVGAMPSGQRRQGNILKLIEKASTYETTSYRGLFDFLRYIEKMKITEQDFGEAVVLGANENLVRIMSIHKSKGLEFPVVLLCGCGKSFNQKDAEDTVLVDADCYLGVNDKHLEEHYFERTQKRNCLARHMKEENLAEELRILYVAMTRAQEKLILIGTVDAKTAKKDEIYHQIVEHCQQDWKGNRAITELQPLGKYQVSSRSSYLSWMILCIGNLQMQRIAERSLCYRIVTPEELDGLVIEELIGLQEKEQLWKQRTSASSKGETYEELKRRFLWQYPYPMATGKKGKLSVSEIKKMSQLVDEPEEDFTVAERRTIMHNEVTAGAAYGTLMHLAMEKLSFADTDRIADIEQELQMLEQQGVLTKEEQDIISAKKISNMLQSDLGIRMRQAQKRNQLYREQQFVIGIPMNQVYPEVEETDLELVQGIIDAYFEEDGELVLMDYKTDKVSLENGAEELVKKYHAQLEYYKRTLEQLTGKTVKETYIYSFYLEKVIQLKLD